MKMPASYHKHHESNDLSVSCLFSARMAGLQEDNKNLKHSLSKVEAERKQSQERSNNLEKVHTTSTSICAYTKGCPSCRILGIAVYFVHFWLDCVHVVYPVPIGKEQPGDRPELQTEDVAAASGAGTDWAQGDAGAAHWQIWVDWRSQISCHEWYASPVSEHAPLHSFSPYFS